MSSCCKTKVCFGFIGEAFATSAGSIAIRDERRNLRRSIIRLFFPERRGQDHRSVALIGGAGSEALLTWIQIRNQRGWDAVKAGPARSSRNRHLQRFLMEDLDA